MMDKPHQSVLLNEATAALVLDESGFYVDGTFGRGGHSQAILNKLSSDGCLLAIDKDPEAIAYAKQEIHDERLLLRQGSFADISQFINDMNAPNKLSGVLLDLGISSPQIDEPNRGFSFMRDGPLDMRMNPGSEPSAKDWIACASEQEMAEVFWKFGDERFARRIARHISNVRQETAILSTRQLADIVKEAVPFYEKNKHPATRVFQATRIFINHELDDLVMFLEKVIDLLKIGGRLVIISFHSLEDRLVKRFMVKESRGKKLPKNIPIIIDEPKLRLAIIGKAIKPSQQEIDQNVRARSGIMRIAERIA